MKWIMLQLKKMKRSLAVIRRSLSEPFCCKTTKAFHRSLMQPNQDEAAASLLKERKALIANNFHNCTQCGKCCQGVGSIRIYIQPDDVERIANYLKLSTEEFTNRFVMKTFNKNRDGKNVEESQLSIRHRPSLFAHKRVECVFLRQVRNEEDGRVVFSCAIYPVRPEQCRTFPHHWDKEILDDETFYNMIETCDALDALKYSSAFSDVEEKVEEKIEEK